MRKTTISLMLLFGIVALLLISACGNSKGSQCPSLSDDMTWTSYGHFRFGSSGDDSTAEGFVSHCGWHIFEGNAGGYGATLQVAPPSEEVVLAWAYQNFGGFRVTKGWTGATDRGAKLGDSMATFQSLYPEFTVLAPGHLQYWNPNTGEIRDAYFDQNSLLTELNVGGYVTP